MPKRNKRICVCVCVCIMPTTIATTVQQTDEQMFTSCKQTHARIHTYIEAGNICTMQEQQQQNDKPENALETAQ